MSTFVLIHGAGDGGWYWHLVEAELRARGHDVVAPDLPADDESLGSSDYADAVVAAVGDRRDLVVVGQSFGGFTAPLVAVRLPVDALVSRGRDGPGPGRDAGRLVGEHRATERRSGASRARRREDRQRRPVRLLLPRRAARAGRRGDAQGARAPVGGVDGRRRGRSTRCRTCRPGSCCAPRIASSRPTSSAAWSPSAWHRARRDQKRPLCRAQSPDGAGRPPGGLRQRERSVLERVAASACRQGRRYGETGATRSPRTS